MTQLPKSKNFNDTKLENESSIQKIFQNRYQTSYRPANLQCNDKN